MKGIAITLATRRTPEAVAAIEKLTGHKIARASGKLRGSAGSPGPKSRAPKPKQPKRESHARESPRPQRKAPKAGRAKPSKKPNRPERSPVVEDIKGDWNGPLPSFLSHQRRLGTSLTLESALAPFLARIAGCKTKEPG